MPVSMEENTELKDEVRQDFQDCLILPCVFIRV